MLDYRTNPSTSPYIWCAHCHDLVQNGLSVKVMKTVYRVEPTGIYPFGVCVKHQSELHMEKREDR